MVIAGDRHLTVTLSATFTDETWSSRQYTLDSCLERCAHRREVCELQEAHSAGQALVIAFAIVGHCVGARLLTRWLLLIQLHASGQ